MKKLLSMLLALMLLCGCAAFAEAVDYVGLWTLTGAEMSGMPVDLSLIGLSMTMDLRADGTCTLTTIGVPEEGTWAVDAAGVVVTDSKGDPLTFVMADGKLEAEKTGMKIIFSGAGDKAEFVGVWEMTGMISGGVEMGVETMSMFGLTMTLTLNEDGTCVLNTSGVEETGTWDVTAAGVAITDPSETVEFTYEDDMLVAEAEDSQMMLTRQGAAPAIGAAAQAGALTGVPAEDFQGKWELTTANIFGMDLTAADMGTFMTFDLAEGKGVYTESDASGESVQVEITYTVTDPEGEPTLLTLLYQDASMAEPAELLAMNMLEDGRLVCVLVVEQLEVSYYFTAVPEEIPAE